jgi:replicative DNA helicase
VHRESSITARGQILDPLPPHDLDAERALLGSMMLCGDEKGLLNEMRCGLGPDSFYLPEHGLLFEAIGALADANHPIDAVSVRAELSKHGKLIDAGGSEMVGEVLNAVPTAVHGGHYARIVRQMAGLRDLIHSANKTIRRAYGTSDGDDPVGETAQMAIQDLLRIEGRGKATAIHSTESLVHEVYDLIEAGGVPTVRTGIRDLDELTGGIGCGEMWILAGRPSMGKSTLGKQIAVNAARAGVPVGLISLEEHRHKVGRNLLAAEAGVDNHLIRKARLTECDWPRLAEGVARLAKLPLYVCDSAATLSDICSVAATMVARHGCKLLVVDYLQRVAGGQGRTRYEQVTDVSIRIAGLLKRLNVAGLVLAQLRRIGDRGEAPRPRMDDLRDSGQVEQDADAILLLHREDYYHRGDHGYVPTHRAELILAKNRDGSRERDVVLRTDLAHQRFLDTDGFPPGVD